MKRSILLSVMFIAAIVAVLGFTAAQWQDHEQVNAELTAGELDLQVGEFSSGNTFQSALFTCDIQSQPYPTDGAECTFTLKNSGDVPGEIWVKMADTTSDCTANGGTGEFCDGSADLGPDNVFATEEVNGTNIGYFWDVPWSNFEAADCQAVGGTSHGSSWATGIHALALNPGDTIEMHYWFKLGDITGATDPLPQEAQGDSITVIFHYTMIEAGSDPGSAPCLTADPT
jgi:hypothetical protein